MNAGIYRLVYNAFRGLWMVVSEFAKSHQPGSGARRVRRARHFLLAVLVLSSEAWAGPAINALPNVTVTTGVHTVINAPVVNPANSAGLLLSIQQGDKKAILSGSSFDIGRASAVNFNHTGGAGSATLVRISGPQTTIEGALNSPNGQIYLINQNGILFGNGARVDVNGLVASTLNMRDSDFMNDLGQLYAYTDKKRAAYVWNTDTDGVANVNGLAFSDSLVQLAPDARIKAALGSSVMLFAPKVINQGSIVTTEGQVVMAAGSKVYISFTPDLNISNAVGTKGNKTNTNYSYAPDSPYRALAGVLVEVDPYTKQASDAVTAPSEITGSVINDVSGRILAQRGNITMASFMVNQSGRVVATTSVSQKGSIRLLARDIKSELNVENDNTIITAKRSGDLTFGANSETLILPEHAAGVALAARQLSASQTREPAPQAGEKSFTDTVLGALTGTGGTVTDEQIFNAPTLEAIGRTVKVNDGANIVVPGGFISLSAQIHGDVANDTVDPGSRLYLGKNTLIDASGLKNITMSLDRNFVEVLLTSNDLQDDPLNKNGFLYHKSVWFDIRHLPDTRVTSLAGYLKQVPRDIAEKLTTAGTVKLRSEGDIVQRTGSVVDVSGGSIKYTAGTHKETWLKDAIGNIYFLSSAPAGVTFTGFFNNRNARTYHEHGYSEGAAAGSVTLNGFAMSLDGLFRGGATYGEYQRSSANLGGNFTVTSNGIAGGISDIDVLNNHSAITDAFAATDALPTANSSTTLLEASMLNNSGFENLTISTSGNIRTDAALNLALDSKLSLTGQNVSVHNDIVARGGSVTLAGTAIAVDNAAKIDVSGLWTNDYLNPASATGRVVNKGGSVSLTSSGAVSLGQGTVVDVSGGGWLNMAGKVSNGDAGSINIAANVTKNIAASTGVAPILGGELRGYALGVGGSLSLTAPFVTIGASGIGDARELWLTPSFFQNGGFSSYSMTGRDGVLVKSGTQVNVQAKNYQLNSNYKSVQTGAHVADFSKTTLLADFLRSSTSLTLATQQVDQLALPLPFTSSGIGRGSVVVQTGSMLQVDSHGSRADSNGNQIAPRVELSGWDNLVYVDGTIKADGGSIVLNMKGDPSAGDDNDFNASQAVWLGSHAQLLAAGYGQIIPNSTGKRAGTVYDGGTISLTAKKGYIVAESGAVLDVSGGSATLDILNKPTTIASNGGTVNLNAREGMLLDATFKAAAPGALGGNLNVDLGRGATNTLGLVSAQSVANYPGYNDLHDNHYPTQKWAVDVVQNAGAGFSHGLQAGNSLQATVGGLAKVSADSINAGGFSKATLKAADVVRFEGNVTLNLPSSLRLDAPVIEAVGTSHVTISAPDVMLSNVLLSDADVAVRTGSDYIAPTPLSGLGVLNVNAQLLDLRGQFSLSGFSQSNLNSSGDIRLTGFSNTSSTAPVGELRTTGTLNMTARQIYPTSLSDYTLSIEGAGGRAVFNGTGAHDAVLSAGGKLTVNAENIDQNGVLLAPFGTITLNASQNLTLENGSLTSVAANGALIPFGYTSRDGLDYLYSFGSGVSSIVAPPEKVVKLNAPNVTEVAGSTVDVSSGGDLYAYEWVPGVGGSTDVLANGAKQSAFSTPGSNATNTWAIMPANKATYGSYDTQYWNGSGVQAGDAVYLSGMPGLAAGYYTLLPARYALLPGAMLVSAVSGHQDMNAGKALAQNDGSSLVSGHLAAYTSAGYVSTSRTAGFVVRGGSDAHKLAEYNDTLSSQRYAGVTNDMQTIDAGRFSVAATSSMVLDGVLKALYAQTGKGAEVDVAAPKLLVVNHGEQTGSVMVDGKNYLAVDENTLSNMNASSLLIGGTRSNGVVNVVSSEVRMGANAGLSGSEVILAATDQVRLQSASAVTGTGGGAPARDLTIGSNTVDGNGALLRVAGGKAVNLTRINADRSHGDLLIENGASVQGEGSVQLDATRGMNVAGTLGFGVGSALTVAAGRVSLGSPDGGAQVTDGLWLTQSQLAPLQQAGSLALKSYSTIDLYGAVNVGNDKLDLTMQSAGISGYQNDNQTAMITARTLNINNADNVAFSNASTLSNGTMPALGSGNLNVSAQTIVSGANAVRVAGFNQVNLNANKEIVAQGVGSLNADKAMTLSAARVTALTAADHTIAATAGLLQVQGVASLPTLAASQSQSAKLNLQGASVILANGANVDALGAKVTVQATGLNATDSVTMQNGSSIMAKGSVTTIKDQTIVLPAGKVALISDHGNVDLQSGSVVDVSPATGGSAGTVNVTAVNGNTTLAGTVIGGANAVANVDAMAIVDANGMPGINQALTALQSFSGSQSYRLRSGDAAIATDVTTKHFVLTADTGSIAVDSKIDASGDKGGSIELYAKNALTLNRGSQLLAKGTADKQTTAGTTGNGGTVILSSHSGIVNAVADDLNGVHGALIDVTGDQVGSVHGTGGNVILRAARTGDFVSTGGVNVNTATTGAVTGASKVSVEAVKVYSASTIDTALENTIASNTNAFAAYVAANPTAFNFSPTRDGLTAKVTPGIEVRSSGDLTLSNDWVLGYLNIVNKNASLPSSAMLGGGILTLGATGNLLLNNNLSYEQYKLNGSSVTPMASNWSYRLVAGADASSVNPEAVQAGAGSIQVADTKYVRTGSGFIDAVAGQDITLGSNSAIYTEGTPDTSIKTGFSPLISNFSLYRELYPVNVGDIHLNALGSITGQAGTSQTANAWLYRAALRPATGALSNPQVRWWSRFDKFANGIGALGGGDVVVNAGGDINNLQFSSATNGRMGGDKTIAPDITNLTVNGGGDVQVKSSGAILNALLVASKGEAEVQAGSSASVKFELMDASAKAYADGSVNVTQVSNPTITTSAITNLKSPANIYFYSYGKVSAVNAVSASGDVVLSGDSAYPGTLYAAAPNGNVTTTGLLLYPSATGNATLLAGSNLNVSLKMSDVDPANLPQVLTAPAYDGVGAIVDLGTYVGSSAHMSGLLHLADTAPVRFYAGNNVVFDPNTAVILPKAVEVYAGHDVVDPNLIIQNNKATDVSIIEAGGNIRYTDAGLQPDGSIIASQASLQVAGPGGLSLIAGKDIDLGTSGGIRSVGDLYNPYLPSQGADIMVLPGAGKGLNYAGMISSYLDPVSAGTMGGIYLPQLVSYMENRQGVSSLSQGDALTMFKAMDTNHQSQFMNSVFYAELRAGGRDAIDAKSAGFGDYTRSERAILTMFPNFTTNTAFVNKPGSLMSAFKNISSETISNPGDLKLFYSQIRSERGGNIELLVPGGLINSGLAVAGTLNKPATDLGIVSVRGGFIDAFVRNNFQVNQSRVFTLGGSDLMLYSALTNIDAGRGAKTSSATPPPVLRISNGQITYDYSAAVSGSGIAALTATGGQPGTVDLFAPYGEINAGEAGIRSAGNINLGARVIIGSENISAGGVTAGGPVASVAGVSVSAPASTNSSSQGKQGDQLDDAAKQASNNKLTTLPSLISVDVISVGDDSSVSTKPCGDKKDCQI